MMFGFLATSPFAVAAQSSATRDGMSLMRMPPGCLGWDRAEGFADVRPSSFAPRTNAIATS